MIMNIWRKTSTLVWCCQVLFKSSDGKEGIFVCYKGTTQNHHVLHWLEFDDTSKFNLYYAAVKLTNEVEKCGLITFENWDLLMTTISSFVIIHPMVTQDMKFKKRNGHKVLTYCWWRVRTDNGLCDILPNVLDFVVDDWNHHDIGRIVLILDRRYN